MDSTSLYFGNICIIADTIFPPYRTPLKHTRLAHGNNLNNILFQKQIRRNLQLHQYFLLKLQSSICYAYFFFVCGWLEFLCQLWRHHKEGHYDQSENQFYIRSRIFSINHTEVSIYFKRHIGVLELIEFDLICCMRFLFIRPII